RLFVAPIESDLKSKSSEKANSLRPTRSSIRHSRRPDVARAVRRRAAILRDTFTNTSFEQPERSLLSREWADAGHPASSDRPARYPWIETGQLPPPEAYNPPSAPPPLPEWLTYRLERHDAAAERTRANDDEDRIMSLLGDRYLIASRSTSGSPSPAGEQPSQLVRLRARNLRRGADDAPIPETYRRERIAPSVAARFDRSPEREQSGSTAIDNASRSQTAPGQFIREAHTSVNRRAWRRLRSSVGVDGLGDRTRSMSPEVWDTLLTTLTPDPQPPSAGSSFASASALSSAATSQRRSAAASSRTSFTDPELSNEHAVEQPCDSAHEDSESDNETPRAARPERPSTNYPSRHRRFVSALDSNDQSSVSHVRADRPGLRQSLPDRIMYAHGHIRDHLLSYGPLFSSHVTPLLGGTARRADHTADTAAAEESQDAQPDHVQTQADGAPNVDEIAWAILRSLADNADNNGTDE
ncbi:hypothetical protein BN1723_007694, partial [Verticillium longisporum]